MNHGGNNNGVLEFRVTTLEKSHESIAKRVTENTSAVNANKLAIKGIEKDTRTAMKVVGLAVTFLCMFALNTVFKIGA